MRYAAGGLYEGVTGADETPKPKKDDPASDLAGALRRVAGGNNGDENPGSDPGPGNNGDTQWGKIIGGIITPVLTNWLTSSFNLGFIGRSTLTAATAAVGVWLGDWIADWFSSTFNKRAKDDPNSPARNPVAQVDLPSVPGGTKTPDVMPPYTYDPAPG